LARIRLPQRERIFIGCEGASERSFVRWLQSEADKLGKIILFDPMIAGGGDPLAILIESIKHLKIREKSRGPYDARSVILDSDKIGISPSRDVQIAPLAERNGIKVLYQEYDHEAVLLRHFAGRETHRPPAGGVSTTRLRTCWPEYEKPADAMEISRRLSLADFLRFLSVEEDFRDFFGVYFTV
jgi:hypothetical protein